MEAELSGEALIRDTEFFFEDALSPEQISAIHDFCLNDLDRLTESRYRTLVIGSYSEPEKERLRLLQDRLSDRSGHEAFLLEDLDQDLDAWRNFYVKFRVFQKRCGQVVGIFEHNDGGHVLELGEVMLSRTFILKRDFESSSIDDDIEKRRFDAMLYGIFKLLDKRNRLFRWGSERELVDEIDQVATLIET